MRVSCCRALLLAGFCALAVFAQGIEAEWDIRPVLKEIAAHAMRLFPILEQIDTEGMRQNGAPDPYIAQINESKVQAKALATDALTCANTPEKLSNDLQTFFRLLALERNLDSIETALRKYWNPALADQLSIQAAQNGANRERFQHYIVELAAEREQEYAIMDHEAQRCRGMLARQPKAEKK
jgi:hypothetical protein